MQQNRRKKVRFGRVGEKWVIRDFSRASQAEGNATLQKRPSEGPGWSGCVLASRDKAQTHGSGFSLEGGEFGLFSFPLEVPGSAIYPLLALGEQAVDEAYPDIGPWL